MNSDILTKVLGLVNSTNEMIRLRNEEIQLYHKLTRAIIGEKLLKNQKNKEVRFNDLPEKVKTLLKEHNVKCIWPYGSSIKLYDSGAVEILTSIKNVTTYVFIIEGNTIFIPA